MGLGVNVFIRDGWKCRHCKCRDGLHQHHVIYRSHGGQDVLSNLITLCWQCHRAHHDGFLIITVLETTADNVIVSFTRRRDWRPQ